ncbi:hypothetical protein A8924_3250 [Saccharopolyspora erythraea NRRL 2338]|uniref:Uncharacterized protein n=1 Tax=Saccharopolyspora erythraea TaxID=1836 RepID=A0ABN1DD25_SACER|nr:hypothetical protein [Saccharopolyspora erythraea]EQD81510.1 hypothetical protein N599_35790 [Saccharopolyspora erythraea D]PFG95871.1 hypothetical protein A8924_3250 [Saccharopolyspora erythraea NRRL 2338]QRK92449.1 hypothetical protein JQX30_14725 [Saccharopolyspora erythraea]
MDPAERDALTTFCDELPGLREECAHHPADRLRLVDRIAAEARARRPILGLLAELLGTSPAEAARALGSALPGTGPGQADEELFGCPDRACDRVRQTPPAGPIPRCPVTGRPMSRR